MSKVLVVGGGPAGMFAAYYAAQNNNEVVLIEKNEKLAFKHFKNAADNGHVEACYNLAYCYEYGLGCKPNMSKAIRYYEMSAEQGNDYAIGRLGLYYHDNKYYEDAFECFELSISTIPMGIALLSLAVSKKVPNM